MSSFPVIFHVDGRQTPAALQQPTIAELQRVAQLAFPHLFANNDVTFLENEEAMELKLTNDTDVKDAFEYDSDDDDEEDDEKTPLEIKLKTKAKPKPQLIIPTPTEFVVSAGQKAVKSTTVKLQWNLISSTHPQQRLQRRRALSEEQISALEYEIQQIAPALEWDVKNNHAQPKDTGDTQSSSRLRMLNGQSIANDDDSKDTDIVARIAGCNQSPMQVKLYGLQPSTKYELQIRALLPSTNVHNNHENNKNNDNNRVVFLYSDWSRICKFQTTVNPYSNMDARTLPSIPPPTDLQVSALYSDRLILCWNHDGNMQDYDYEYYIYESRYFGGMTEEPISATENDNWIEISNLPSQSKMTFTCVAKYYDPNRVLDDNLFDRKSKPSNSVTVNTPPALASSNANGNGNGTASMDEFVRNLVVDSPPSASTRWAKTDKHLEINWASPSNVYGDISYEIKDKINGVVLGEAQKLPVFIQRQQKQRNIFVAAAAQYRLSVRTVCTIMIGQRAQRKYSEEETEIEITIEDEKANVRSSQLLQLNVNIYLGQEVGFILIDTFNCNYAAFCDKILHLFSFNDKKDLQRLVIQISIHLRAATKLLAISSAEHWNDFINNYAHNSAHSNSSNSNSNSNNNSNKKEFQCLVGIIPEQPSAPMVRFSKKYRYEIVIGFDKLIHSEKYECQLRCASDRSFQEQSTLALSSNVSNFEMKHNGIGFRYAIDSPGILSAISGFKVVYLQFRMYAANATGKSQFSAWSNVLKYDIQRQAKQNSNNNNTVLLHNREEKDDDYKADGGGNHNRNNHQKIMHSSPSPKSNYDSMRTNDGSGRTNMHRVNQPQKIHQPRAMNQASPLQPQRNPLQNQNQNQNQMNNSKNPMNNSNNSPLYSPSNRPRNAMNQSPNPKPSPQRSPNQLHAYHGIAAAGPQMSAGDLDHPPLFQQQSGNNVVLQQPQPPPQQQQQQPLTNLNINMRGGGGTGGGSGPLSPNIHDNSQNNNNNNNMRVQSKVAPLMPNNNGGRNVNHNAPNNMGGGGGGSAAGARPPPQQKLHIGQFQIPTATANANAQSTMNANIHQNNTNTNSNRTNNVNTAVNHNVPPQNQNQNQNQSHIQMQMQMQMNNNAGKNSNENVQLNNAFAFDLSSKPDTSLSQPGNGKEDLKDFFSSWS